MEGREKGESREKRWGWVIGALIAIFLAGVVASRNTPKISLFDRSNGNCGCRVKLWCDCPYWPDDGMCRLRDCSVCECPDNEFPEIFKGAKRNLSPEDLMCQEGKPQATVDRTLDSPAFRGWVEIDNPWAYDDETDNDEMKYVNLLLNPERYTGYSGPSSRRIWDAIYVDNIKDLWWDRFGTDCPHLQTLAIHILSQTCSATSCERNWSMFEQIHTKKRNRLRHKRLNDLVFVHYNMRLRERQMKRDASYEQFDPISLENFQAIESWVQVDGPSVLTEEDVQWITVEATQPPTNEDEDIEVPNDDDDDDNEAGEGDGMGNEDDNRGDDGDGGDLGDPRLHLQDMDELDRILNEDPDFFYGN